MNHTSHIIAEDSSTGNLVAYGALFGVLHILTGPDHIAAMVTISAKKGIKAFFIGAQWGLGHSAGLLIIFCILLTVDHGILDKTYIAEWIVGVFLIFIGFLGFYRTHRYHKKQKLLANLRDLEDLEDSENIDNSAIVPYWQNPEASKYILNKYNILSLITGILHGLAGPGGVLGVLPAILIQDKSKSAAYLGTFCATGIITMGSFSALWGELSKRVGQNFGTIILGTSSLLSVIIGCLWIGLLASNQMHTVFGE